MYGKVECAQFCCIPIGLNMAEKFMFLPAAKRAFLLTSPEQSEWTGAQHKELKDLTPELIAAA